MSEASPGVASRPQVATRRKACSLVVLTVIVVCLVTYFWKDNRPLPVKLTANIGKSNDYFDVSEYKKRFPNVIIIGVRKCGTRALLRFLDLHPLIRAYRGREPHFFDDDRKYYDLGPKWYLNLMPLTSERELTIEKTPAYFHSKFVPERMHKMFNGKLLIILKDPVTRIISDYVQITDKKRRKGLAVPSFEDFSFDEFGNPDTSKLVVDIGIYIKHYTNWLKYFSQDHMLSIDGHYFVKNPLKTLRKIETFLEIGHEIRSDQITFSQEKGFFCPVKKGNSNCLMDSKGRAHPSINKKTLQKLRNFYLPYNKELCNLVKLNFTWCQDSWSIE